MSEVQDQAARELAQSCFDVNMVVEAGAGTGKTTLLVERAVRAVVEANLPLHALVLITFMEKAAFEIRARLKSRLTEVAEGGDPSRARAARRALAEMERAVITTIHGFCHRLVSEFALPLGLPWPFEVLDGFDSERLWSQCWRRWLKEAATPASRLVIQDLVRLGVREDEIARLAVALREAGAPSTPTGSLDLSEWADQWRQRLEALHQTAQAATTLDDPGLAQVREVASWVEDFCRLPTPMEKMRRVVQCHLRTKLLGNQKRWRPATALKTQKVALATFFADLKRWQETISTSLLARFLEVLQGDFLPYWRKVRHQAGYLTYDDLLWEARRLLLEYPLIRGRIQERWRHIMVDEFQDTDPIQVEILYALAKVEPTEEAPWVPGRLFAVGDPKQSIYRFRGADVETYARVRDAVVAGGGQTLQIVQNFRSDGAILDFVNRHFQGWPSGEEPPPYWPQFMPLLASRRQEGEQLPPRVQVYGGQLGADRDQRRQLEARWAARLAQQAVQGAWPVWAGGLERPITYADIAVIVPNRTGLFHFRRAFAAEGVPLAALGSTSFFRRDEVRGFAAFLAAVLDPEDQVHLAAWLASPWVGLSPQDLAESTPLGSGRGPAKEWVERLREWHQQVARYEAVDYFDALDEATGLSRYLSEAEDRQGLANLLKLRELARTRGRRWGSWEFSQWLLTKVAQQDPEEEGEVGEWGNAVTLSTVHRAKGLEWPLVIVANWHGEGRRATPVLRSPDGRAVAWNLGGLKSAGWDWLEAEEQRREEAERLRLLYVALTRARDYLVVFDTFGPNETPLVYDPADPPKELEGAGG
ncbi:MAG: UvrD-helicase domain-containing protein [Firmicutes bacterium]|nr:UvrD-helicase domain-containing protein [Bacillota bacterium]